MADTILYPTANGTTIQNNQFPVSGSNYDKVDELVQDEDTTYVWYNSVSALDLYQLSNHVGDDKGNINSVTVHARSSSTNDAVAILTLYLRTGGTTYAGAIGHNVSSSSYTNFSETWTTNPDTSSTWTWSEIDALEAGQDIFHLGIGDTRVTNLWIVVDYDLPSGEIIRPDGDDNVNIQFTTDGGGVHYTEVNEVVLNPATRLTQFEIGVFENDTYTISNHISAVTPINSVTVVANVFGGVFSFSSWAFVKLLVNMGGTEYLGGEQRVRTVGEYSQTWDVNPDTGIAWTLADIDNLKAGVAMKCALGGSNFYSVVRQVYIIIDHSGVPPVSIPLFDHHYRLLRNN